MNEALEKKIEKLNYFTNTDVSKFINSKNTNIYLDRYTKNKKIIRLKRGIYVSNIRINKIKIQNKLSSYIEYISTNIIMKSSYLSTEYILYKYGIITENVYSITNVTTKTTNIIKNIFSKFIYQNINKDLFWGYKTKQEGGFMIFEAYVEKALLDRLWLKKDLVLSLSYFEALRLNLENINFNLLSKFVKKYNKTKINKAFILLKKLKGQTE